jgi:glycine/D-amino acid oxidase-like deaminating enzyme
MERVAVVGAGVIGLSTVLHLQERFPGVLDLTVVSDSFSPDITSDKAGMLFLPIDFRTPEEKRRSLYDQDKEIQRWSTATFQKFHSLYKSEENAQVQLCLEQGYMMHLNSQAPDPWYKDLVFGFRHVKVDSVEASLIHVPPSCVDVWAFGTYVVEASLYMHWLMEKSRRGGAKFEQRRISSFDELSSYDIIINCTGLGSHDLLGDKSLYPVHGQIATTTAPWLKHWVVAYYEKGFTHVLPRGRDVALGGNAEAGNWSETSDPEVSKDILQRCQHYLPSLCDAEVTNSWAGLRPLRDPIRLDSCEGPAGSLLVHCYGHGGQGIVLSWGCALDIGNIIHHHRIKLKSRL